MARRNALRRLSQGATLAVLCLALPAEAAEVVDVRVGQHPDFTRVVFELDDEAAYSVQSPQQRGISGEVVIDLGATSHRRVITSRSEIVESVRIEPTTSGALARIQVRGDAVDVADMVLLHPPRIVVDLRHRSAAPPTTSQPAASEPAPQAAAAPPIDPWADVGELARPEEEPDTGAAIAAGSEAEAEAPEPVAPSAAEPEAIEVAEEDAEWWQEPDVPEPAAQPDAIDESELLAADEAEEIEDETDVFAADEPEAADAPAVAVREPAEAAVPGAQVAQAPRKPAREPAAVTPGASDGGALRDPTLLVALVGIVAAVLLGLWLRARRRAPREEYEPLPTEDLPEPEPEVEARSEGIFPDLSAPAADEATEPVLRGVEPPRFTPPPAPVPEPEVTEPAEPERRTPLGRLTPPPASAAQPQPAEVDQRIEEFERRIGHMEKRLEEVWDAKERLERHVSAQTEELRVQRAAIARTQRVLRNLTRPDDSATEPAPKS